MAFTWRPRPKPKPRPVKTKKPTDFNIRESGTSLGELVPNQPLLDIPSPKTTDLPVPVSKTGLADTPEGKEAVKKILTGPEMGRRTFNTGLTALLQQLFFPAKLSTAVKIIPPAKKEINPSIIFNQIHKFLAEDLANRINATNYHPDEYEYGGPWLHSEESGDVSKNIKMFKDIFDKATYGNYLPLGLKRESWYDTGYGDEQEFRDAFKEIEGPLAFREDAVVEALKAGRKEGLPNWVKNPNLPGGTPYHGSNSREIQDIINSVYDKDYKSTSKTRAAKFQDWYLNTFNRVPMDDTDAANFQTSELNKLQKLIGKYKDAGLAKEDVLDLIGKAEAAKIVENNIRIDKEKAESKRVQKLYNTWIASNPAMKENINAKKRYLHKILKENERKLTNLEWMSRALGDRPDTYRKTIEKRMNPITIKALNKLKEGILKGHLPSLVDLEYPMKKSKKLSLSRLNNKIRKLENYNTRLRKQTAKDIEYIIGGWKKLV